MLIPGTAFYLGIAQRAFGALPTAEQIDGSQLTTFAWTNDAEVYRGNWKLLGSHAMQSTVNPDTAYKIVISGQMMVEGLNGQLLRPFDPEKDGGLEYRKVRSPLLVQDLVQASVEQTQSTEPQCPEWVESGHSADASNRLKAEPP
uniref:hypothetical protein n=1 Tax=uncultured Sphingomonas sp. TaxID=158754 RepID=UPI0025F1EA7C|nr:hypothetical protein [uncultured Sphingomonas sp.]